MAISYATAIRSVMLLSELEQVKFTDTGASTCYFAVRDGDGIIFANTYSTDSSGYITVYDLDKVLESAMPTHYRTFTFVFGTVERQVTVFKCSVLLDHDGESFLSGYFMTPLLQPRYTCAGRYEVLYAYCPSSTSVTVHADYYKDGAVKGYDSTIGSISGVGYVDCSPAQFESSARGSLVGYSVVCGSRRAEFRVLETLPAPDPSIIYLNCFGVWETIYLSGIKETSGDYTRHQAVLDGKLRSYAIDEVIKHNASTGPMRPGSEALAYDLARSKSVFLLDAEGVAGDEIVVLGCQTTMSNDNQEMPTFTFEYRLADRRTDKLSLSRPPRIFDDTFDETFN